MEGTGKLRRHEHVRPGHASRRLAEGVAEILLVEVNRRAVKEAVAQGQRIVLR